LQFFNVFNRNDFDNFILIYSYFRKTYFKNECDQYILRHRELWILACAYNFMHKSDFIIFFTVAITLFCIVSSYSLVKFDSKLFGIGGFFIFLIILIDCLVIFVAIFGEAGSIIKTSEELRRSTNEYHADYMFSLSARKRKCKTRQLKSCRCIRIEFFSSNYFDRLTPLTLMLFCVQNTANLVLLGG